jgi:DNA/RNA endonuclease G (NUC1)
MSVDLATRVTLANVATDPDGDDLFYRVQNVGHGSVRFTADGKAIEFTPEAGYFGTASFELIVDDGFSASAPATFNVNVSNARLLDIDFLTSNPRLDVGQAAQLIITGDFADEQGVVLNGSYLQLTSSDSSVVTVDQNGLVTAVKDGVSILKAERNGVQAVTATRIGSITGAITTDKVNTLFAESYGLNLYPQSVTLTEGITRQLLVGINGYESIDLRNTASGTQYFVSNPSILRVDGNGLVTTLHEGIADVTVIYGASEFVIPVRVEAPHVGPTTLGEAGGAVQSLDGAIVMVAPGALQSDTQVSIRQLAQAELPIPAPDQKFTFAGAFRLDIGNKELSTPVQIAIPAPANLAVGTTVFIMREGEVPDATGVWKPMWIIEESAVVGSDGMIRTQSPPWPGVTKSTNYVIGVPSFRYNYAKAQLQESLIYTAAASFILLGAQVAMGIGTGAVAALSTASALVGAILIDPDESSVVTVVIPKVGTLPYVTSSNIEINPAGIPVIKVGARPGSLSGDNPKSLPTLNSAEVSFDQGDPIIYIKGDNFLIQTDGVGGKFKDLIVNFYAGKQKNEDKSVTERVFKGEILEARSGKINGEYVLAVRPPASFAIAGSSVEIIRRQAEQQGLTSSDKKIVEYKSRNKLDLFSSEDLQPTDRILVSQVFNDTVTVINSLNPKQIIGEDDNTSLDLIQARIPVGIDGRRDGPRYIAATSDGTRAYVPLEQSGEISLIDVLLLRQVDTDQSMDGTNSIKLRNAPDARPAAIVIGGEDKYAYVADRRKGSIYVIDIDPNSVNYNTHIGTIAIDAPAGISRIATNRNNTRLFATTYGSALSQGKGEIVVINIDLADKTTNPVNNSRKWHRQIARIPAGFGLEGVSTGSQSNQMVFTNRRDDTNGFGVLTINDNDPSSFSADVSYSALKLGPYDDYFDVNEGMAAVVTADGKYAFVAGRNGRFVGFDAPSVNGPGAGSNIGVILDPFSPNARLVAATRPIPMGLTTDLVTSADGDYLYATYPGASSVFAFDIQEILDTIDKYELSPTPEKLRTTPLDDLNPKISVAADLRVKSNGNNTTYEVPAGAKTPPLGLGSNPYGVTRASNREWVFLRDGITLPTSPTSDLTPTFAWRFAEPLDQVTEVNLFVSTFGPQNGLMPQDDITPADFDVIEGFATPFISRPWENGLGNKYQDFNPGRILTATWKASTGLWYGHDRTTPIAYSDGSGTLNSALRFDLPLTRELTAGQSYYVAVEAITSSGKKSADLAQFTTYKPVEQNSSKFASVSVITHGFNLQGEIPDSQYEMARSIVNVTADRSANAGLILEYHKQTGYWLPKDENREPRWDLTGGLTPTDSGYRAVLASNIRRKYMGKPLVLLTEWTKGGESIIPISGFSEAAADAVFAAMVQLDQDLGGGVVGGLADQGALLDSPLHFIGFSRGAVVNSEIIQRLGVYFPNAGGVVRDASGQVIQGDLQMTTIDPHDFNQASLPLPFQTFDEPRVQVWENVTFADNYYQTGLAPAVSVDGIGGLAQLTLTPSGRDLPKRSPVESFGLLSDSPRDAQGNLLGQPDLSINLNGRVGFVVDDKIGGNHSRVMTWYGGTADLGVDRTRNDLLSPSANAVKQGLDNALSQWSPALGGAVKQASPALAYALDALKNVVSLELPTHPVYDRLGELEEIKELSRLPVVEAIGEILGSLSGKSGKSGSRGRLPLQALLDVAQYAALTATLLALKPWYSAGGVNEGIGEGWYYSVLGGGKARRPQTTIKRVPLSWDNTLGRLDRGDSSVPTLFNGNFEAGDLTVNPTLPIQLQVLGPIGPKDPNFSVALPGWTLHGGGGNVLANSGNLVKWDQIQSTTFQAELNRIYTLSGAAIPDNTALALANDSSITHNRFVIPDWGNLRLDLHAPTLGGGTLEAILEVNGTDYNLGNLSPIWKSVSLVEGTDAHQVAYGKMGFETFQFEVPNELRGKVGTLTFRLTNAAAPVYLDNIFFKSQHLLFGNPSDARYLPDNPIQDNHLLERPQFALSYNDKTKIPNWVSWELNKSWRGDADRDKFSFRGDELLPQSWYKVPDSAYTFNPANPRSGDTNFFDDYDQLNNLLRDENGFIGNISYIRGHIAGAADRDRNDKDLKATFVLTNVVPQHPVTNKSNSPWNNLESYLRNNLVEAENKNLFITAGGYGVQNQPVAGGAPGQSQDVKLPLVSDTKSEPSNRFVTVPEFLWKIVLVGENSATFTPNVNTKAFAIMMPNAPYPTIGNTQKGSLSPYSITLPTGRLVNVTTEQDWFDWRNWRVNINDLEAVTGLDFFSEISDSIEEIIENADISSSLPVSPLLGQNDSAKFKSLSGFDAPVWHDRFIEDGIIYIDSESPINSSEISETKIGTVEKTFFNSSILEIRSSEVGSTKPRLSDKDIFELNPTKVRIIQQSLANSTFAQIGSREINSIALDIANSSRMQISAAEDSITHVQVSQENVHEGRIGEVSSIEVSSIQLATTQITSTQINPTQVNPTEIPLSSRITLQQFLSSHNFSLQNTTIPTWTEFLTGTTPFNLNIEITDLPTGQLAEANITSFDSTGRPTSGTLTLDTDANGLGWFIDSSPWDNAEFGTLNGETLFRATLGSEAYGRYDLLTTILHELGHLAGLISGNPTYDSRVQTINGNPTYLGNGYSTALTADRSHLTDPTKLMGTYLAPGMRKLPSQLELQMLADLRNTPTNSSIRLANSISAHQDATPMLGITNGQFDQLLTQWDTRGSIQVTNAAVTLREDDPLLANLSQTFIIPNGAKTLQFTLTDAYLDQSPLNPGDTFEVALLNAQTRQSLISPISNLTQTDSLLNLQNSGQLYRTTATYLSDLPDSDDRAPHCPSDDR